MQTNQLEITTDKKTLLLPPRKLVWKTPKYLFNNHKRSNTSPSHHRALISHIITDHIQTNPEDYHLHGCHRPEDHDWSRGERPLFVGDTSFVTPNVVCVCVAGMQMNRKGSRLIIFNCERVKRWWSWCWWNTLYKHCGRPTLDFRYVLTAWCIRDDFSRCGYRHHHRMWLIWSPIWDKNFLIHSWKFGARFLSDFLRFI